MTSMEARAHASSGVLASFRSRVAVFGWILSSAFVAFVAAMVWVTARQGPPSAHSPVIMAALLSVFGTAAVAIAAHTFSAPCVLVQVRSDGTVLVVRQFPLRRVCTEHRFSELGPTKVVATTDGDGDRYYLARLALPGGEVVTFTEGHHLATCDAACAQLEDLRRAFVAGTPDPRPADG